MKPLRRVKQALSNALILALLGLAGCAPTYPREMLAPSLIRLCKEEYGIDVSVRMVGDTIGVQVPLEKLFDSTLKLSPEVGEKLDGVILATSRVVLSTDRPPDFYVVVARDKRIPGVELKLTRYVQDIRRLNYGDLSRNEYTKRMLFEFGLGLGIFEGDEEFHIEEVKLEEFLADQMAQRIKSHMDETLVKNNLEVKAVHGQFIPVMEPGGLGRFVLTLDAQKKELELLDSLRMDEEKAVVDAALSVVVEVLRGYRFTAFEAVEIRTPFLTNALILNRDVLELYRQKKVNLSELLLPNDFNFSPHDAELLLKK